VKTFASTGSRQNILKPRSGGGKFLQAISELPVGHVWKVAAVKKCFEAAGITSESVSKADVTAFIARALVGKGWFWETTYGDGAVD
jgi:hypothetical protein